MLEKLKKSLFYIVCNDVIFKNVFYLICHPLYLCHYFRKFNALRYVLYVELNSLAVVERENSSAAKDFVFACLLSPLPPAQ